MTAKEEDAEFVRLLRVGKDASDQDIQEALNRVFGRQEDKTGLPEDTKDMGHILLDDEVGEDSWFCPSHKSTTLAVTRSSVRVDRSIRRAMMDLLRSETPYDAIIASLENEGNQEVIKGLYKYRLCGRQLYAHRTKDAKTVEAEDYWKMVVPNSREIKIGRAHV